MGGVTAGECGQGAAVHRSGEGRWCRLRLVRSLLPLVQRAAGTRADASRDRETERQATPWIPDLRPLHYTSTHCTVRCGVCRVIREPFAVPRIFTHIAEVADPTGCVFSPPLRRRRRRRPCVCWLGKITRAPETALGAPEDITTRRGRWADHDAKLRIDSTPRSQPTLQEPAPAPAPAAQERVTKRGRSRGWGGVGTGCRYVYALVNTDDFLAEFQQS